MLSCEYLSSTAQQEAGLWIRSGSKAFLDKRSGSRYEIPMDPESKEKDKTSISAKLYTRSYACLAKVCIWSSKRVVHKM